MAVASGEANFRFARQPPTIVTWRRTALLRLASIRPSGFVNSAALLTGARRLWHPFRRLARPASRKSTAQAQWTKIPQVSLDELVIHSALLKVDRERSLNLRIISFSARTFVSAKQPLELSGFGTSICGFTPQGLSKVGTRFSLTVGDHEVYRAEAVYKPRLVV